MTTTREHNKYANYHFEDFLQDSYFIESMKTPSQESEAFWEKAKYTLNNPEDFIDACSYMKKLDEEVTQKGLTKEEISLLWDHITDDTIAHVPQRKRWNNWKFIQIAASVALVVLGTYWIYDWEKPNEENILSFAVQTENTIPAANNEAVLILSDKKQVRMKEDEATISYSNQDKVITVQSNNEKEIILQEEISVYNQLVTPKGKRSTLILADGSKVWLNAGTQVIYPKEFTDNKREIFVNGEIYIEVTPDKNRPFYVKTKKLDVRVLGTKFNVMSYSDASLQRVVLVSGSVAVDNRDQEKQEIALLPNQMYEINNDEELISQVNTENYISWVDGLYIYNDKPLDEILKGLCNYYGIQIEFVGKSSIRYSGKLDLKQSFDELLDGLKNLAPIEYTKYGNNQYNINCK